MPEHTVHMLWVYGDLGLLEKIAARSFIQNGYSLNIWTYGKDNIKIDNAKIKDANIILPEKEIFFNSRGGYAGFSDLFRYCVLSEHGGIYSDTDVISIKNANEIPLCNFFVQENTKENESIINGNVISYQSFEKDSLIEKAKKFALEFPKRELNWGEIGPELLTKLVAENKDHGFTIFRPEFANNYNYWDCPNVFLNKRYELPPNYAGFVHLYNEMWRIKKIDKNKIYGKNTFYGKLQMQFLNDEELINASTLKKFKNFFKKKSKIIY